MSSVVEMVLLRILFSPFRAFLDLLFSSPVRVEGDSMTPTLEDRQLVLVVRPVFPWNRLRRSDVVVLMPPAPTPGLPEDTWFIKRVAGMPDEEIVLSGGRLYADDVLLAELAATNAHPEPVDGPEPSAGPGEGPAREVRREWWNGPDEYFVLGDNPNDSRDSRAFGPVPGERVIGRVWLRIWPFGSLGPVR